tara:strand:+ start:58 stop:618 length:561 start_codon:yes stop_codon:yes gene_type:complete
MPFRTVETSTTSKTSFVTARSILIKKLEMYKEILNEVTKAFEILRVYDGKKLGKKTREKLENNFYNNGLGCLVANIYDPFVWYVRNDNHVRKFGSKHDWQLTIHKDMNEASPKVDSLKIFNDNKGYFVNFKNQIEEIEKNLASDAPERLDDLHKDLETRKNNIKELSESLNLDSWELFIGHKKPAF